MLAAPYLRVESLMVKGQPSGSTSYAPGFPATVELEVGAAAPATPLAVALQPYLQWMNSSPICSATAMLFTTTVSLAASTGHLSARGQGKIGLLWIKWRQFWPSFFLVGGSHLKSRHIVCRMCAGDIKKKTKWIKIRKRGNNQIRRADPARCFKNVEIQLHTNKYYRIVKIK